MNLATNGPKEELEWIRWTLRSRSATAIRERWLLLRRSKTAAPGCNCANHKKQSRLDKRRCSIVATLLLAVAGSAARVSCNQLENECEGPSRLQHFSRG